MADVLYTEDVAERLGNSVEGVRALVRRGSVPAPFKVGRRNAWRRADFDQWLERQARVSRDGRGK